MVLKERRRWRDDTDNLQTHPSQRFIAAHEKDTRSPRFKSRKSDADSSASEKGSPVSTKERSNTIGERGGVSASQKSGISYRDRGNTFSYGTEDEYEGVPIQSFKGKNANHGKSVDNAEAKKTRKRMKSKNEDETKAYRYRAPLASPPYKRRSEANAELAYEEAAHEESYDVPKDEGSIRIRDFGSWNPPNEQETHRDPRPHSPDPNHSIDETSDRDNQAVSDVSQEPEETETLPKPPPSHSKARDSLESQLQQSGSGPTIVDAGPIHDPVEEPVGLGTTINDEAPDATCSPDSTEIVDPRPTHDPVEEPLDLGINTDDEAPDVTHDSHDTTDNVDARPIHNPIDEQVDLRFNVKSEAPDATHNYPDTIKDVDVYPIHDPFEEQSDLDINVNDKAPDSTRSPDAMENVDARLIPSPAEEQVN